MTMYQKLLSASETKMAKIALALGIVFLSYGTFGFAEDSGWHTYSLTGYPKSELGCAETARSLGEKFTKVTGQTVFRARCEKELKESYDIVIIYVTPQPVRFVSTRNELAGPFRTMPDCLAALPNEVQLFSSATGLTPFVSYCFKELELGLKPYVARIDGWGDAKLLPLRFEQTVYAAGVDGAPEVLDAVLKAAKASGIPVHRATFDQDGSQTKLVIRFYGSGMDQIYHSQYFKMNEVAQYYPLETGSPLGACRSQLDESAKEFSSTFATPGIWFCASDTLMFGAKLYLIRIRRQEGIRSDMIPDRYLTFDECNREKPSVRDWYEKTLGIVPFSIVCSWKSGFGTGKPDAFVMRILTKTSLEEELPSWPDPILGLAIGVSRNEELP